jgi:hypothetical protein
VSEYSRSTKVSRAGAGFGRCLAQESKPPVLAIDVRGPLGIHLQGGTLGGQ